MFVLFCSYFYVKPTPPKRGGEIYKIVKMWIISDLDCLSITEKQHFKQKLCEIFVVKHAWTLDSTCFKMVFWTVRWVWISSRK